MIHTVAKSVGRQLYFENAGLFLLLILVLFGFLRGEEHMAIAEAISTNYSLLIIVIFLWSFYTTLGVFFF
ncbi:MAG: hypothetical protein AAF519_06420, partial [Bacteroidota bacterium]